MFLKRNVIPRSFVLLSFAAMLLSGCGVSYSPNTLPVAKVGQPYYVEINVKTGRGPIIQRTFSSLIKPENGLHVELLDWSSENHIKIYGIPEQSGNTKISFSGFSYGTMLPGKEIDKTYVLRVEP